MFTTLASALVKLNILFPTPQLIISIIKMSTIPVSARLASIALILEPKIETLFWQILSVPFIFILTISDAGIAANYIWYAILKVVIGAMYPLFRKCNAVVRGKAVRIVKRERRILSDIRMVGQRGDNSRIWAEVCNILRKLGGPDTKKDLRDIYEIVARPEIAGAWDKLVGYTIWAFLIRIFFGFNSFYLVPRSNWLYKLVYPAEEYKWIHVTHMIWIASSQSRIVATVQLRALLLLQRFSLLLLFNISTFIEGLFIILFYSMLENVDRFFWVLGKVIALLTEQFFFEFIFAGIYRLWQGHVENWDFRGRNFYLYVKFWRLIQFLWESRDEFPQRTNSDTNWTRQESYSYTPLKSDTKHVRLLVLHPRIPLADVRCTLFEVPLNNMPSYEAVSYTWGKSNGIENIWVNGKRLSVPKSSYTVLSTRSSFWRPKILWMDALCINQGDKTERSSQVALMREIYSKAFIVSVCLQTSLPPEGTLPQAHELLEGIYASDMIKELMALELTTYSNDLDRYFHFAPHIRQPKWLSFLALIRNPWFSRIWVIQEVALATSVRVFFGRRQISWRHLLKAIFICTEHQSLASFLEVTKDPLTRVRLQQGPVTFATIKDIRERFKDGQISFSSALYDTYLFKASDPRDRVFGLYGFYVPENNIKDDRIKPNYKKSKTRVYKDVAQYLLDQEQPLRLLSYGGVGFFATNDRKVIGHEDKSVQEKEPDDETLPTWCPNWTRPPMAQILSYGDPRFEKNNYSAGGKNVRRPEWSESEGSMFLILQGRVLGPIVSLGPKLITPSSFFPTKSKNEEHEKTWKVSELMEIFSGVEKSWNEFNSSDFVQKHYSNNLYPHAKPPQAPREAFWRTLIGDRTEDRSPAPALCNDSFEKFLLFWKYMSSRAGGINRDTPVSTNDAKAMRLYQGKYNFGNLIQTCGINRRFCITENGYIGMVPPLSVKRDDSCEGDIVYIIRGTQVPFVLRPVINGDPGGRKRFQLVGEAYIHGVMNGEMARWEDENSGEESIELV